MGCNKLQPTASMKISECVFLLSEHTAIQTATFQTNVNSNTFMKKKHILKCTLDIGCVRLPHGSWISVDFWFPWMAFWGGVRLRQKFPWMIKIHENSLFAWIFSSGFFHRDKICDPSHHPQYKCTISASSTEEKASWTEELKGMLIQVTTRPIKYFPSYGYEIETRVSILCRNGWNFHR